jgi:hypothetical protein
MPTYLIEAGGERLLAEGRTHRSARKLVVDRYREKMVVTQTTPIEAAIAATEGAVIVGREEEANDKGC